MRTLQMLWRLAVQRWAAITGCLQSSGSGSGSETGDDNYTSWSLKRAEFAGEKEEL
jgi:hypothetical protein